MEDPPCIGLDPDTDPCPFCGAQMHEPCKHELRGEAMRVLEIPDNANSSEAVSGSFQQFEDQTRKAIFRIFSLG
jgi:hypothetical protein